MRLLAACAALLAWTAGSAVSVSVYRSPFPPPSDIHVSADGAAGDILALAFGARRLFADVWFIRLMQYYGTPEAGPGGTPGDSFAWLLPKTGGGAAEEAAEAAINNGAGRYPDFFPLAMHILQLDPSFTGAALYGAASLAFNMNRPGEAEALLRYGLRYHPHDWKSLKLLTAIGYSRSRDPSAVAASIAPLLKDPDCPVMLKQLAAFLDKKAGNYAEAAALYADILTTSRDPSYASNARKELALLAARGITPR